MHPPGKCHPSPSFQVNTQSLWHFSLPTYFHISPGGPGMGQSHFSSLTKALNPHSPWPRQVPTVPVHIALCSQPEKGGAEDPDPVMQGVPRAPAQGAPQPLTSTPGLRLVTPCRFSPYWKLETPGTAFPAPRLQGQKVGGRTNYDLFLWWSKHTHSSLHPCSSMPISARCVLGKAAAPGKMHVRIHTHAHSLPQSWEEEVGL